LPTPCVFLGIFLPLELPAPLLVFPRSNSLRPVACTDSRKQAAFVPDFVFARGLLQPPPVSVHFAASVLVLPRSRVRSGGVFRSSSRRAAKIQFSPICQGRDLRDLLFSCHRSSESQLLVPLGARPWRRSILFADSQVHAKQGSNFWFAARRPATPIFCHHCRLLLGSGGVLQQVCSSFFIRFSILQPASRLSFSFGSEAQCRSDLVFPLLRSSPAVDATPVLVCAKLGYFQVDLEPSVLRLSFFQFLTVLFIVKSRVLILD
jgi:hypothetical protein